MKMHVLMPIVLLVLGVGGTIFIWRQKALVLDGDEMVRQGDSKEAVLSFSSFDGGGPEYKVVLEDSTLVSYHRSVTYNKPDHEQMTGAGYTITYTFTGLQSGETEMVVEERSSIGDNRDWHYLVKVDEKLYIEIETISP